MITALRRLGHMNWLRVGIRLRMIKRFYDPDKGAARRLSIDLNGQKYEGSSRDYIDWFAYFFGAYERSYLHFLQGVLRATEGATFIDVGANTGHHSMFLSRSCACIHAFEPNPSVRGIFEARLSMNGPTNISIHPFGLGARDERLLFYLPEGSNQGTGSFVETHSTNNKKSVWLEVRSGDAHLERLSIGNLKLIKIDVEGFERDVILGLKRTLEMHRPVVAFEFSRETRRSFATLENLVSSFPRDYVFRQAEYDRPVLGIFNSAICRLEEFAFDTFDGNVIAMPRSRS